MKNITKVFLALLITTMLSTIAVASSQPTIKIIVPYAPGSVTDILARNIQKSLADQLLAPVIVDYKQGAGGHVAAQYVAQYNGPDTLLLITSSGIIINYIGRETQGYNLAQDLIPVVKLGTLPQVLVANKNFRFTNLSRWTEIPNDYAITSGSGGIGTGSHLNAEVLKLSTKKNITIVPYRSAAAMSPDLIAGRLDIAFDTAPTAIANIKSGRLNALAVTSDKRLAELSDVPTLKELGFDSFKYTIWMGVFASRSADPTTIKTIQKVMYNTLTDPVKSIPYKKESLVYNSKQILNLKETVDRDLKLYEEYFKTHEKLQ